MNDLCFIDIETTGSVFGHHEILDIAAIRTSPDAKNILGDVQSKIKPRFPDRITRVAQRITEYRASDWDDAIEPSREFWDSLRGFWTGCTPVCHNPAFERAFITLAMLQVGIDETDLDYHWIGTESLFWPWILAKRAEEISLSNILRYFGLPGEPTPHTAVNGVNACRTAYLEIVKHIDILS